MSQSSSNYYDELIFRVAVEMSKGKMSKGKNIEREKYRKGKMSKTYILKR